MFRSTEYPLSGHSFTIRPGFPFKNVVTENQGISYPLAGLTEPEFNISSSPKSIFLLLLTVALY